MTNKPVVAITRGMLQIVSATFIFAFRGAKAERDAAVADRADKVVDVEFNARNAYFAALRSDAEYKLASGALDNARAFLNTAHLRFEAGDIPRAEVLRSQVELSRAEQ